MANLFVTDKATIAHALVEIGQDLQDQLAYLKEIGKFMEAKRLEERVKYDMEMIRELGYCPGIENYSRYFDGPESRSSSFLLIGLFPGRFSDGHRRIACYPAPDTGDVRRRSRTETDAGGLWFPFTGSFRQPSPHIR